MSTILGALISYTDEDEQNVMGIRYEIPIFTHRGSDLATYISK